MSAQESGTVDVWLFQNSQASSELLVRRVLALRRSPSREGTDVRRDAYGRLEVTGAHTMTVSVSHTGELTLVAVGNRCRVGVDVEVVRERGLLRLPEHALSPRELLDLQALEPGNRLEAFLGHWTRKEALLKAAGVGLAIEPRSIGLVSHGTRASLVAGPAAFEPFDHWFIGDLAIPGHAAALATDVPGPTIRLRHRPDL